MAKRGSSPDFGAIRKRLKASTLNKEDVRHIDGLLGEMQRLVAKPKTGAGRKVLIARLPFGMDIVK
jgi:hypothetical protein